jgi:hypothetical protein
MNRMAFLAGLMLAVAAALLLLLNVIPSGLAVALGILGIGLISVSARTRRGRP